MFTELRERVLMQNFSAKIYGFSAIEMKQRWDRLISRKCEVNLRTNRSFNLF